MICKDNQELIDALLRLKVDEDGHNGTNNKIASYQYQDWKTRKANETTCVNVINQLMKDQHNEENNKIASVQPIRQIGEVAELQSYLKL
jgi:hypothetical protein